MFRDEFAGQRGTPPGDDATSWGGYFKSAKLAPKLMG